MKQPYPVKSETLSFQSLPAAEVMFIADAGLRGETLATRHSIRIPIETESSDLSVSRKEVTLALTIPQMAEIVKSFFWEVCRNNRLCHFFLKHMMRKRWLLMTSKAERVSKKMCYYR